MNITKQNIAVKIVLYAVMVLCGTITAFSAVITAINISNQWYSQSEKTVKEDIKYEAAWQACTMLTDSMYTVVDAEGADVDKDYEFIEGEKASDQFGYSISGAINRHINDDLKSKVGVYTEKFQHDDVTIEIYLGNLDGDINAPEEISTVYNNYSKIYQYRIIAAVVTIAGFFISLGLFLFLALSIGRKKLSDNEPVSLIRTIPVDLATALLIVPFIIGVHVNGANFTPVRNFDVWLTVNAMGIMLAIAIVSAYLLLLIYQVKMGQWWKHTVIYKLCQLIKLICIKLIWVMGRIALVWRTALVLAVCLIINLFIVLQAGYGVGNGIYMLMWFAGAILISIFIIYSAICLKNLKEGGKHLAEGNLEYQIDRSKMHMDFGEHADNLNSIAEGMSKAVEERMKSERLKAALITNVSHDIKTPLTSIINYVDFLKKEEIDNEKANEYIEVLDRQSQRLKKLTEDLVEASKAATGNIKIEMLPCKVGLLMTQSMAEYEEKAKAAEIDLKIDLPEDDIVVLADGRHMWRVFDNLLNNICKYSQPHTRVYQTLERNEKKAVITYKNVSKYQLNISGDELTERFIRGDSSRHTDGSGLGLSIARNLIESMGGTFAVEIDGDLFKIVIEFDVI